MKTKFIAALLCAGALSSCSKNEVTEVYDQSDNLNTIGIDVAANMTRANDTDATALRDFAELKLYGYDADGAEGNITFGYDTSSDQWKQTGTTITPATTPGQLLWSDIELPLNVFSMHKGATGVVGLTAGAGGATYTANFSQTGATIADHVDLVHFSSVINSIPAAGKIRGTFRHSLSRGELKVKTANNNKVLFTFCDVNAFATEGTATLTAADGSVAWSAQSGASAYSVISSPLGSTFTRENGEYINVDGATSTENGQFMMIPQAVTTVTPDADGNCKLNATTPEHNIAVQYRMNDSANKSIVGYTRADECPNYDASTAVVINDDASTSPLAADAKLFVSVFFPFTAAQTFVPGTAYELVLNFDNFGGYYADDVYYTEDGYKTNIKLPSDQGTGDQVLADENTPIGIYVEMTDWASPSAE